MNPTRSLITAVFLGLLVGACASEDSAPSGDATPDASTVSDAGGLAASDTDSSSPDAPADAVDSTETNEDAVDTGEPLDIAADAIDSEPETDGRATLDAEDARLRDSTPNTDTTETDITVADITEADAGARDAASDSDSADASTDALDGSDAPPDVRVDPNCTVDDVCNARGGESCENCPWDCGACPAAVACCAPNTLPGCPDDLDTEACVCALDSFCCTGTWDQVCTKLVESGCDKTCDYDPICGDALCDPGIGENCETCATDCGECGGDSNCCDVHTAPTCEDPGVLACVCDERPACCVDFWDVACTAVAAHACGAACESCGDGVCAPDESCESCEVDCGGCPDPCPECVQGPCCATSPEPSCAEPSCASVVCDIDSICCTVGWDPFCVALASSLCGCTEGGGCGDGVCDDAYETCLDCQADCGPCLKFSDCCIAHPEGGCDDAICSATVCEADTFCCDVEWDQVCVDAALETCVACGYEPVCGDDQCDAVEDIESCPQDCTGECVPPGLDACCQESEGPGCTAGPCQDLVCTQDPFCCDVQYDDICVDIAEANCEECQGDPLEETCGDGVCDIAVCETCASCVADCGECPLFVPDTCCEPYAGPGCPTSEECSEAVCVLDSFCCNGEWDEFCAACAAGGPGFMDLDCTSVIGSCFCE